MTATRSAAEGNRKFLAHARDVEDFLLPNLTGAKAGIWEQLRGFKGSKGREESSIYLHSVIYGHARADNSSRRINVHADLHQNMCQVSIDQLQHLVQMYDGHHS